MDQHPALRRTSAPVSNMTFLLSVTLNELLDPPALLLAAAL